LSTEEVGEVISASEYAHCANYILDVSVCVNWTCMGLVNPSDVQRSWKRFKKCKRDWFAQRGAPQAWIAVFEATKGLHTHLVVSLPPMLRGDFKRWCRAWVMNECERRHVDFNPKSLAISRHNEQQPRLHWQLTHYLIKGADVDAVVQSGQDAPDGEPVRLGHLLAYAFEDPGIVPFDRVQIGPALCRRQRRTARLFEGGERPWRSAWERGERDVNYLYPADFIALVRRKHRVATLKSDEIKPVSAAAKEVFDAISEADALHAAVGALTEREAIVMRDGELVGRSLEVLVHLFELASRMEHAADRHKVRETVVTAVRGALSSIAVNGEEVALVFEADKSGLIRQMRRALCKSEQSVRELASKLGVEASRPSWALRASLDLLAV
jgi:hypothetical protein